MRFQDTVMAVKKDRKYKFSTFGFSTILLTFVMMCIMTFGVLSLVTANSDLKLSKKVAEKSKGIADAKETSYHRLERIDTILSRCDYKDMTNESYRSIVLELLQQDGLDDYLVVSEDTYDLGITLHWEINITETQYMGITVYLLPASEIKDNHYQIRQWYTAHRENENEIIDDTLHLIGD